MTLRELGLALRPLLDAPSPDASLQRAQLPEVTGREPC
jgi:hypothetical protein